jgi:hypothetical protein
LKSHLVTALVAIGVLAFGSVGAFAAVGHVNAAGAAHRHVAKAKHKKAKRHHAARHHAAAHRAAAGAAAPTAAAPAAAPAAAAGSDGARSAAAQEYGTRPGKGCGDPNHIHTGPPGNPGNTGCPQHP